jgi:hypothetical protein
VPGNSGRSLWKPYESEFGRVLRCRAANPTLSRKEFSALFEDESLYPLPGHRQEPHLWADFDNTNPSFFFKYSPDRSLCTTCLRLGYHSWLFDIDWITHCPIHGIPLTRHHPASSLNLVESSNPRRDTLFNPAQYFTTLDPLVRFCRLDADLVPLNLFNPMDGPFALTEHLCHFANELTYPPLMLALFPHQRSLVQGIDLPIQKFVKVVIDRSTPDTSRFYLTALKIRCHYIREQLRRRILWMIRSRNKTTSIDQVIQHADLAVSFCYVTDVVTTAYKIWLSLLQQSTDTSRRPNDFFGAPLYRNLFGYQRPLIPTPMLGFSIGKKTTCPTFVTRHSLLPLGLTLLVYEIDCWCLFRSILQFLVSAKTALAAVPDGHLLTLQLIRQIPLWARANAYYSDGLAVYLIDDRFVVLFPRSYIDPACSDIEIDSPEVKQHVN